MKAVSLLREQLQSAHETQEATMADVTDKAAHFTDTNKAIPVGAAYAHSILGEDMVLSTMLLQKEPLAKDNSKTGLSIPMPSTSEWEEHETWYKTVKVDLPKLKEFAKEVYKTTDDYLASLTDEDLDKQLDRPMVGKHTIAWFFTNFILLHIANLTGEISSVKGFQGLKGYPF